MKIRDLCTVLWTGNLSSCHSCICHCLTDSKWMQTPNVIKHHKDRCCLTRQRAEICRLLIEGTPRNFVCIIGRQWRVSIRTSSWPSSLQYYVDIIHFVVFIVTGLAPECPTITWKEVPQSHPLAGGCCYTVRCVLPLPSSLDITKWAMVKQEHVFGKENHEKTLE